MQSHHVVVTRSLAALSLGLLIAPLRAQDVPSDAAAAVSPPSEAPAQADASTQKQDNDKKGQTSEAISGATGTAETALVVTKGVVDLSKRAGDAAAAAQATEALGGIADGVGVVSSVAGLVSAAQKDGTAGIIGEGAQQAVEKVVATAGECIAGAAGQAVATVVYKACRYAMDNTETGKAIQNKEVELLVALKNNVEGTALIGAPGENSPAAYTNTKLEKALKDSGMMSGSGTYAAPLGGSGPNTDVNLRGPGAKAKIAAHETIQINPNADLSGLFRSPYAGPAPNNPPGTPSGVNVHGPQSIAPPSNASRVSNLQADIKTYNDNAAAWKAWVVAQQKQYEEDQKQQRIQDEYDRREEAAEIAETERWLADYDQQKADAKAQKELEQHKAHRAMLEEAAMRSAAQAAAIGNGTGPHDAKGPYNTAPNPNDRH